MVETVEIAWQSLRTVTWLPYSPETPLLSISHSNVRMFPSKHDSRLSIAELFITVHTGNHTNVHQNRTSSLSLPLFSFSFSIHTHTLF